MKCYLKKLSITIVILVILLTLLTLFYNPFSQLFKTVWHILSSGNLNDLVDWIKGWGILSPIISILLMVFQSLVAPLPSFLIAGANGIVFGIYIGSIISWIGGMVGAIVSLYLSRWFGEKIFLSLKKEQRMYKKIERLSGKHGFFIVLIARLIPIISFDFISYAAGFVRMRFSHFFIATGIGMIPGTVLYSVVGHDIVDIKEHPIRLLVFLFIYIGLFLLGKWIKKTYLHDT